MEERFDEEFGEKAQESSSLDLHDFHRSLYDDVKHFIKQEILSVIEELRMEETKDEGMGWEDDLQRADGYNQAVEQLNAKIEEIKKRYEK